MSYENVTNGGIWVIRHKPTGKLLPANPRGYGHTQMNIENNGKMKHLVPRMFLSEREAKMCLGRWLLGVHKLYWEDGLDISEPEEKRVREDMEVIEIELITGVKDEQIDW